MDIQEIRRTFSGHRPTLQQLRRQAAVLVPLVELDGQLQLLYEVRSQSIRQPGEVCFPGGRMEPGESVVDCALRETQEELGIAPESIEVIALLDYLYLRDNSLLHPVLGLVDAGAAARLTPSADEVTDTFFVPLTWLKTHPPAIYRRRQPVVAPDFPYEEVGITPDYHWRTMELEEPIYHGLPYPLWGLTARITCWLLEQLT